MKLQHYAVKKAARRAQTILKLDGLEKSRGKIKVCRQLKKTRLEMSTFYRSRANFPLRSNSTTHLNNICEHLKIQEHCVQMPREKQTLTLIRI